MDPPPLIFFCPQLGVLLKAAQPLDEVAQPFVDGYVTQHGGHCIKMDNPRDLDVAGGAHGE